MASTGCRLAVDIGGTFTDIVLQTATGFLSGKVLTTTAPEEGVIRGTLAVLQRAGVSFEEVELVIHGTTLATNAIIERRGATVIGPTFYIDVENPGDENPAAVGTARVSSGCVGLVVSERCPAAGGEAP